MAETRMDIRIRAHNLATRALKDVQREMSMLGRNTSSIARTMMTTFGNVARTIGRHLFSLKSAIAAVGIGLLGRQFLDAAKVTESLKLRLSALLGSVREGTKLFKDLADFAARVPFEYREIMTSATQLAGIMRGGRKEIMQWMPLIADLAAATGLGIQETTSQIQRMLGGGAAAADRFRELGILAMLGFTSGVKYSVEETRKILWDAWAKQGSRFKGLTDELAKSWSGMISMLQDAWFQFRQAVMEAGLFDFMKGAIKIVLDYINRLKKEGRMEEWANKISDAVLKMTAVVTYSVAGIIDAYRGWENILLLVKKGLLEVEVRTAKAFATANDWLSILNPNLERYARGHRILAETAQKELDEVNKRLAGQESALMNAGKMLENLKKRIQDATKELKSMTKSTETFNTTMTVTTQEVSKEFETLSAKMADYFRTPIERLEYQRDEMLKIAKENAKLRTQVEEWYVQERLKLIKKELDEQLRADKKREEEHKKLLEGMYKDDLAYWIKVINTASSKTEEIERAWMEVRRIVEEQNIGMVRGFKIGWTDAVTHFRSVGHRMYEFGRDTAENIHTAFSDYFFDAMMGNIRSLKDAWKSFCDYLKQAFLRAVADILASKATQALGGMFGNLLGGGTATTTSKKSGWDWFDLLGGIGKGISGLWGWLGKGWDWLSGFFHSGGSVGSTGAYMLEGGEYVVPREQVSAMKSIFGTRNLDKVLGGKTQTGKKRFQTGGEVTGGQRRDYMGDFYDYVKRMQIIQWLWGKVLYPMMQSVGLAGLSGTAWANMMTGMAIPGATYTGAFGGIQGAIAPYTQALSGAWGAVSPYLGVAGLGYMGGSILGSYIGPQWFGKTGQYGGYGGALGAVGGYAAGGALGGTGLGALLGSWAGPIGAILGGLIGTVAGSAIGPTPHKTKAVAGYTLSGMQLLKGRFGSAQAAVRSTHGHAYGAYASSIASQLINQSIAAPLKIYSSILKGLPSDDQERIAGILGTFDLPGAPMTGGRTADVSRWAIATAGMAPQALREWFMQGLTSAGYDADALMRGRKFALGYMPGSWARTPMYMHTGGMVPRTGSYILERGEKVVPKEGAGAVNLNFYFDVKAIDTKDFNKKIDHDIMPRVEKKIRNQGYIRQLIKGV